MTGKAALILVFGFGTLLLILGSQLNESSARALSTMSAYAEATESHTLAVSGAEVALALVYADTTWRGPLHQSVGAASYTVEVTESAQNLELVSVSTFPAFPSLLHDTVIVTLSRQNRHSFSRFAWVTHDEGAYPWKTGDTVWGRFHSNDDVIIFGSPIFIGKVTAGKGFLPRHPGIGVNQAVFRGNYETGVIPVPFPANISTTLDAASSGGRLDSGEVWITLTASGTAQISLIEGGPIIDSVDLTDPSFNGVLASTGRVNVTGIVDGRITVASATDVRIVGDVRLENPNDDLIGLVAQQNVVVRHTGPNSDGVVIEGALVAATGSLYAEGLIAGPVTLFGSVAQRIRGVPMGIQVSVHHDPRLADAAFYPPFYPMYASRTPAITNWWESFRVLSP